MGQFIRDHLPDPVSYFEGQGVNLKGPGVWKAGPCLWHGGSDAFRVNTRSGGWVCMACEAKGGDVLAFHMRWHGLDFVTAARELGAYEDDGKPHRGDTRPKTLPPREAMSLIAFELYVVIVVMSDAIRGVLPSDDDWQRFLAAVGRIQALAGEYAH